MQVVFSDLDGTLLDPQTYAWEAARPALERLERRGVPLVFVTSKTRAETLLWRERIGNRHPFVVENGGALAIPAGYFPFQVPGSSKRPGFDLVEFGERYGFLVETLAGCAAASGCPVRGFHDMSTEEVAECCGMPLQEAALAREREYDEPFLLLDPARAAALRREIEERGMKMTEGGRFHHITGGNDKAGAVRVLADLYVRLHGPVQTIGLGDGLNDAEFLNATDTPVLVRSASAARLLAAVPRGRLTRETGPAGWNHALLEMIPE